MQIVIDIAIFLVSAIIFTFVGMAIRKKVCVLQRLIITGELLIAKWGIPHLL